MLYGDEVAQGLSYVFAYSISGFSDSSSEYIFSGKIIELLTNGYAKIQIKTIFSDRKILPSVLNGKTYEFPMDNLELLDIEEDNEEKET